MPTRASIIDLYPVSMRDASRREIVEAIACAAGPAESFVSVNAHTVYLAEHDANFREVLENSWRFCDGFGVHLLAVIQGLPKPRYRNTPTDFMWDVFARLHGLGKCVYLLGDEPGVAESFAAKLEQRYPGLVSGHRHGFFQMGSDEEREIVAAINASGAHLLCTGMGQPRQEKWVYGMRGVLKCHAVLNLGASMAFAVGARKRGPVWATNRGLEWLFRVVSEPRRMFFRYFGEIPWLMAMSLRRRFLRSGGKRRGPTTAD